MHRPSRSSSFIAMSIGGVLAALFSGCAHELTFSDHTGPSASLMAFGAHPAPSSLRSPAAVCDQYLALLSAERFQPASLRYGTDGQCWSGDADQQSACKSECRGLTYSLIKGSLAKLEAEKNLQSGG